LNRDTMQEKPDKTVEELRKITVSVFNQKPGIDFGSDPVTH